MKELYPDAQILVAYTHNVSNGGIRVHQLPKPGETVRALDVNTGIDCAKGTNVAVASSRCGARVAMAAAVPGGDWFARGKEILAQEKIDDRFVICVPGTRKTSGCILIDDDGNNMIVLSSTTPQFISRELITQALEGCPKADYCITGYEIAEESVRQVVQTAREYGLVTVMNPSPVPQKRPDFWNYVDILVLNEVETAHMLRLADQPLQEDWVENARQLRRLYGCAQVVITLGSKGFVSLDAADEVTVEPGQNVHSMDTTGAGDGFLGAMAARLAMGDSLGQACSWANTFAAYSVQRPGTISSYPSREEIAAMAQADR